MPDSPEGRRLQALRALEILHTAPEAEFDDLAELAALTFKAPIALISLVDDKEQWFKSRIGFGLESTPRNIAFCDHTIQSDAVMVVPDALEDQRFCDSPLVTGDPGIRFYAGAPLTTPAGYRIGTLCVLDYSPRRAFGPAKQARLKALAASIMQIMRHRVAAQRSHQLAAVAADRAEMLALAEEAATVGTWVFDVITGELTWSHETYKIFGFDPSAPPPAPEALLACYRPSDAARLKRRIGQSVRLGQGYENQAEIRRPDGEVRHVFSRAMHRSDETGSVVALYGAVQDVTAIKQADAALREREARLRTLNWALTAYARSSSALLRGADASGVADNVCAAIVADDSYTLACVALAGKAPEKSVHVVAHAGKAAEYAQGLPLSWDEDLPEGRGPTGRAIRSGEPQIMADSLKDPHYAHWRARGLSQGIRSSVTVPFSRDGTVLGVLMVYATRPAAFGPEEMAVFTRLAAELAFAMRLEAERARLARSEAAQKIAQAAEAEALKRLTASEARLRLLAENVPDIILMYDPEGIIQYVSPAIRRFGYDPELMIGRSVRSYTAAEDHATLDALQSGTPLPGGRENEMLARTQDGRTVWLQGNPAAIYDDAGNPVGIVTAIRDVTERRLMEEELRRKRLEAEAAAQVKSQFLANMSHEIRTPLTSVVGFAGLLSQLPELPPEAQRYADRIVSGGNALLTLVNDVLDFSRLEEGKIELDLRPCVISALLDETVGLIRQNAESKGLALRVDRHGNVPDTLQLDHARLRQVLLNLLSNAVKFTSCGSVTLVVRYEQNDGGRLCFEVVDTGVGIAPGDMELMFQRFSQVDGSNTREFGGAGLGLAISKGLVEAMGGRIGVESAEGRGATFSFCVQAPECAVDFGEPAPAEAEADLAPLRILLTDDVAVNRELVSIMLTPFNVALTEATNGAEAVEIAARIPFDVILMDLQMPVMDGLEATRQIRANPGPNQVAPILAITANVLEAQLEACRAAGMTDHIGKPIDPRELLGKIAASLDAPAA